MEESIRRAEKLVHATKSVLAEMNFNLTFDDLNKETWPRPQGKKCLEKTKRNLSLEEEMEQFEQEFKSDTFEMLSKMDKLLDPNPLSSVSKVSSQSAKARDKMKEINRKIDSRRQIQSALNDRQKLLNLINQEDFNDSSPGSGKHTFSSRDSEISKRTYSVKDDRVPGKEQLSPKKTNSLPTIIEKPATNVKDLKNKLLETQEIVDRGFQTARKLTQRVENLAKSEKKVEKTPSSAKTFLSEPINLKSEVQSRKSESNETIKSVNSSKCAKCQGVPRDVKEKTKKKEKGEGKERRRESRNLSVENLDKPKEHKNLVVSIRRLEARRPRGPILKLQRLPSMHLKGGLQIQKIHNLEIPPENKETVSLKANTSIVVFSHDQIEKEKSEKILENIKKENSFCPEYEIQENRFECFKCGELIRIRETSVDPRELDKLLLKCNFDVFDPRIDEFVERCGQTGAIDKIIEKQKREDKICEKEVSQKLEENEEREIKKNKKAVKKTTAFESKVESVRKNFKIKELSEQLSRQYKEKANKLEDDHLEFESILRNLFKKVDESREFFDECRFLSSLKKQEVSKKVQHLTATKPVVVCLTDGNDASDAAESKGNEVEKPLPGWDMFRVKKKRKKLDKKDVINKCKSRTSEYAMRDKAKIPEKFFRKEETDKEEKQMNSKRPPEISPILPSLVTTIFNEIHGKKSNKINAIKNEVTKEVTCFRKVSESSSSLQESIKDNKKDEDSKISPSANEMKTENDYESDFEGDSVTSFNNESNRNSEEEMEEKEIVEEEEEEEESGLIKCMNKLSTISEVDSELERKLSEVDQKVQSAEDKTRSQTSKNGNSKTDLREVDAIKVPNKSEINDGIKEVLSKAFEKGIAYTLQHQRKALESTQISEQNILPENGLCIPLSSSSASEDSVRNKNPRGNKNEEEKKSFSSPKSSNSSNKKGGDIKASKNRSNGSQKSSSTEIVASLKEVLSALNDQFARTRSLADKLTENVKETKNEDVAPKGQTYKFEEETVARDSKLLDDAMITNLQKLRKDLGVDHPTYFGNPKPLSLSSLPKASNWKSALEENLKDSRNKHSAGQGKSKESESSFRRKVESNENSVSTEIVSDDELSSVGEVNVDNLKDRKRKGSEKSESSSNSEGSFRRLSSRKKSPRISSARSGNVEGQQIDLFLRLGSNNEEMSYSEGEIPSNILMEAECSSVQSIGEVISERISAASSME